MNYLEAWQTPTHQEARELVWAACRTWILRNKIPYMTAELVERIQAVGWLESHYGSAWKEPGNGSCNWGAIQCHAPVCAHARRAGQTWLRDDFVERTCFAYVDTTPQSDGSSKPYSVCFRRYPSHEEGALALVEQVVVRRPAVLKAALKGPLHDFSAALHASRYYEGWGATVAERIAHHEAAVRGSIRLASGARIPEGPQVEVGRAMIPANTLVDLALQEAAAERP